MDNVDTRFSNWPVSSFEAPDRFGIDREDWLLLSGVAALGGEVPSLGGVCVAGDCSLLKPGEFESHDFLRLSTSVA